MTKYYIYSGTLINGKILSNAAMHVLNGGSASCTTVNSGSYVFVSSGGTVDSTTVNYSGHVVVKQGGTANNTIVNSSGSIYVYAGIANYTMVNSGAIVLSSEGIANITTVGAHGSMNIFSDGIASSTTVNGYMHIYSGGVANNVSVLGGGSIYVGNSGKANNISLDDGVIIIYDAASVNNISVRSHGQMYIHSGGTATDIIWTPCVGYISAANGAYITYADKYSGVYFGSGNKLLSQTDHITEKVISGWLCSAYIMNDGVANNSIVEQYGYMEVRDGGKANFTTLMNGSMHVSSGGKAKNTVISDQSYLGIFSSGTTENSILSNGGSLFIYSGGIAIDNQVDSDGQINVSSGGVTICNVVDSAGWMFVHASASANGTTVNSGGSVYISSDGNLCGTLQIHNGGYVYFEHGGIFDFSVIGRKIDEEELINDLSMVSGSPQYTITISAKQLSGVYKLAQGAENLTGTALSIGNGCIEFGKVRVNGLGCVYNGRTYSVNQDNGNLTLSVSGNVIVDNDLDGNGLADVILVHTKQGYSGAWLSTGTNSVIKWGGLSDVKAGTEILGTGKLYGSADDGQDIFFTDSKTVGAWNVVDGKVTGYKSIMSVNATTNVIGLGDFNGDGATDLLLRSTSGDLGFYGTDGTGWEYLIGLGKEWSVAAVGDLNGDGLADTIVRHDAGFAGTFLTQTDGTVKWANLDTLAKDMTIVGTGDFNGDGIDDVLLQKSNGWIGAWLVEDGSVDSFMGICTNKSAIEQIADFNGDGIDDLRVRDGNAIGVLYVNGADNTTWQYFQSVGTEWDTSFSALT